MKKAEIFKIQRPILQSRELRYLAYNKNRTLSGEFPPTKELMDMFKEDELKIFVIGWYDKNSGTINIVKKTTEDVWNNW